MIRCLLTGLVAVALASSGRADSFELPLGGREREAHGRELVPMVPRRTAPNRIVGRKTNVSGALVTLAKARYPLQAISPAAPAQYGDGYANVARDPATGQADGLILLAIEF